MIFFDPKDHKFTNNRGEIVPSVTQLLRRYGYINDKFFNKKSADFGTTIHNLTAYIDQNPRLFKVEDFAGSEGYQYIKAYQEFKKASKIDRFPLIEKQVDYKEVYAGIIDRIGISEMGTKYLIDIKTGTPQKWHDLQLYLYQIAYEENNSPCLVRNLYLNRNGTFKFCEPKFFTVIDAYRLIQNYQKELDDHE